MTGQVGRGDGLTRSPFASVGMARDAGVPAVTGLPATGDIVPVTGLPAAGGVLPWQPPIRKAKPTRNTAPIRTTVRRVISSHQTDQWKGIQTFTVAWLPPVIVTLT